MAQQFEHALVRELAWSIGSVPLMTKHAAQLPYDVLQPKWFGEQLDLHLPWLEELDRNSKMLEESMPQGKLLLGKRFEHLIWFWLHHSPHFRILQHNHVFSEKGQTVGELDFLVEEVASCRKLHIEVACKFYLSANESPQWRYWVGPGQKDTLRLKMDKLVKQLSILQRPIGQRQLKEWRIGNIEPCLLMKGYFFHHFSQLHRAKAPKGAEAKYSSGWWLKVGELPQFLQRQRDTFWTTLPKRSWLAPVREKEGELNVWNDWEAELELAKIYTEWKRPIMLIKLQLHEGLWEEVGRGFMVGNDWGSQLKSTF